MMWFPPPSFPTTLLQPKTVHVTSIATGRIKPWVGALLSSPTWGSHASAGVSFYFPFFFFYPLLHSRDRWMDGWMDGWWEPPLGLQPTQSLTTKTIYGAGDRRLETSGSTIRAVLAYQESPLSGGRNCRPVGPLSTFNVGRTAARTTGRFRELGHHARRLRPARTTGRFRELGHHARRLRPAIPKPPTLARSDPFFRNRCNLLP
ncbi:hypothetical protein BHM03_00023421 [Ensete ventricosum]|nr:hypothetical protein BHM03_00023421 [Ensete ventricosum]